MDKPETSVRIVCHANICRSPLTQFQLIDRLPFLPWDIQSRGTHARSGMNLCPGAAGALVDLRGAREFTERFRSQPLSEDDLAAGLILTASSSEKSAIARRDPTTRRRTFTLREAAALATHGGDRLATVLPTAAELARFLDAVRRDATVSLPRDDAALDIVDAHMGRRTRHARTLQAVAAAVDDLAGALRGAWGDTAPGSRSAGGGTLSQ